MNQFKKDLQVSDEIKEIIKSVEKVYKEECREMTQEDKESLARYLKSLKEKKNSNER